MSCCVMLCCARLCRVMVCFVYKDACKSISILYMNVYTYMCIQFYMHINVYICMYVCVCVYVFVMSAYLRVYICVCILTYACVYAYVFMCICRSLSCCNWIAQPWAGQGAPQLAVKLMGTAVRDRRPQGEVDEHTVGGLNN